MGRSPSPSSTARIPPRSWPPAAPERIVLVACGTSLHAAMAARPAFESWARLPVACEIASEFRYQDTPIGRRALVIGVSQSGETIDTLYALGEARRRGAPTIA